MFYLPCCSGVLFAFLAVARSCEPKYNIAPIAGIAEPITHQWLRHATECNGMQQNATECNDQLVYTLYTSLLLCLWNLQPKRSTDIILCYLQGHARIELILILEDASVPQLQWRQALENLCPWHPWLGPVEPWLKRHWKCVATASRRRRAVVPVSSKDAFGTSKDWQRAWTKMARGWNDLSSTSSYWWGATYTPVYTVYTCMLSQQSHLEWRDNSALLVHSHNKQQYCLEIPKFIIVCDSSW